MYNRAFATSAKPAVAYKELFSLCKSELIAIAKSNQWDGVSSKRCEKVIEP
jgi:hypothetical protein